MRFIIVFLSVFICACATPKIERIPIKCKVEIPIKPNCNDFIDEFDCGKAKAKYINALEKALQKCI